MKMALSLTHSLTAASTRWGGATLRAFIRAIRLTIAVIVLPLVCIPVCMFTFLVGARLSSP